MRDLITVATFTIKDMIQRKSFIISTLIILVLIVVGFNIPNIISKIKGDSDWDDKILLVDSENIFEENLEALNTQDTGYNFIIQNEKIDEQEIKNKINNGEIDSCLVFTKGDNEVDINYYVESAVSYGEIPQEVLASFANIYKNVQLSKLGLNNEQLQNLNMPFNVNTIETDENAASGNQFIIMMLSILLFYAIYFCAYQVSSSITTEKTSKIMETLITSTNPRTIVLGKTIGIGIVGLLQIILIILVAVISAISFLPEGTLDGLFDMTNITPMLGVVIIIYFIFGYFFYALLYALTGSTVSKPEDINSANGPIAIIAVAGFYLAYFSMMNPSSDINVVASVLPISSPFSMPFRVMMGTATTTQLISSIVILIVSIILVARISIKIYSSAILNYGTKLSIKDMMRIYKNEK